MLGGRPSAYRCKNEHSVTFKICQNAFLTGALPLTPLWELTMLPRPASQLGRGRTSILPPSALTTRHLQYLVFWGPLPQIFFCRTTPGRRTDGMLCMHAALEYQQQKIPEKTSPDILVPQLLHLHHGYAPSHITTSVGQGKMPLNKMLADVITYTHVHTKPSLYLTGITYAEFNCQTHRIQEKH